MRVRRAATLLVLLCTTGLLPSPQGQEKGHQVAPNTRLQVFFSELETQWLKAVQEKNPAALNRIVADDFHLRTAIPRNPVSREEWLLGVFGRNLQSFQLRQLAVRQVSPEIAVVSFIQTETYESATPQTETTSSWIYGSIAAVGTTGDVRTAIFRRSAASLFADNEIGCN